MAHTAVLSMCGDPTATFSPERRLMFAIIIAAINDALGCSPVNDRGQRDRESETARRWFDEAGRDFREVCHLAELEPAKVRRAALAYIEAQEGVQRGKGRGLNFHALAHNRLAAMREAA